MNAVLASYSPALHSSITTLKSIASESTMLPLKGKKNIPSPGLVQTLRSRPNARFDRDSGAQGKAGDMFVVWIVKVGSGLCWFSLTPGPKSGTCAKSRGKSTCREPRSGRVG